MEPVIEQLVYEMWVSCFFVQKMEGIFMATKNKIINIKVFFDGNQDASQVFA